MSKNRKINFEFQYPDKVFDKEHRHFRYVPGKHWELQTAYVTYPSNKLYVYNDIEFLTPYDVMEYILDTGHDNGVFETLVMGSVKDPKPWWPVSCSYKPITPYELSYDNSRVEAAIRGDGEHYPSWCYRTPYERFIEKYTVDADGRVMKKEKDAV